MPIPVPDYESETENIKRFYDRVCTFVHHQRMADPLMDVLVYFLKEYIKPSSLLYIPFSFFFFMNVSDTLNYCHVKIDKWWSWECMKTDQVPTHFHTTCKGKIILINICKIADCWKKDKN